jgi:hypothetical protein
VILTDAPSLSCVYQVTVPLPAPLAGRAVYDGPDGAQVQVLPQRLPPVPGYPAGPHRDNPVLDAINGMRYPTWLFRYAGGAGKVGVEVIATHLSLDPTDRVLRRMQVHGHTVSIVQHQYSTGEFATWLDDGWRLVLEAPSTAGPPSGLAADQLDRIIKGLVWPK